MASTKKKGGLGRGFDSLFLDNSSEGAGNEGTVSLPIGDIEPDKNQPRTNFSEDALLELENSIREYGVLQPLLVRPMSDGGYMIVAGERRWRAARRAGLSEIPVIIKSLSDREAAAIALIENLQREDLDPIEQANGIKRLMDEFGYTQNETGEKLSMSRPAIANALRLLMLPEDVLARVSKGELSAGHARTLLGINDRSLISDAAKKVAADGLSVRQTEALVKMLNKAPAPPKRAKSRDKFYDEVELAIGGSLARNVKIINKGKGGKLEIEYFDRDDLLKLSKLFNED